MSLKLPRALPARSFCVVLAALCLPATASAQPPAPSATKDEPKPAVIPFEFDGDRRPFVSVMATINGHGPYRFILDTGLNEPILIDRAVAAQLDLKPLGKQMRMAPDDRLFDQVGFDKIVIAGKRADNYLTMANISGYVGDMGFLGPMGYSGVIGTSILETMVVQIDFQAHELRLFPPGVRAFADGRGNHRVA